MVENMKSKRPGELEFEIHFAAELGTIPPALASGIYGMGFHDDRLVGRGVVFSPNDPLSAVSCPLVGMHVTWDCFDRDEYVQQRDAFAELLRFHGEGCIGYAHAEVIKPDWDIDVEYKPFDSAIPYPLEPFEAQSRDQPKTWDIHISADADRLDPRLCEVLGERARMYYIDVMKASGRVVRVFTIQGIGSIHEGRELFRILGEYVTAAGGVQGAIKYEETCFWATYGNPQIVPPVIDNFVAVRE